MRARAIAPHELTSSDVASWISCADAAVEPNPFLRPSWLLPALADLNESTEARLVVVEDRGRLVALVPVGVVRADDERREATRCAHRALVTRIAPTAMTLGTPLISREAADGVAATRCLLDAVVGEAGATGAGHVIMEWVADDGPVAALLAAAAAAASHPFVRFDTWERAFLARRDVEHDYWTAAIGSHRLRTIRQHRRRLDEACATPPAIVVRSDVRAVDDFVALEVAGWKGHRPDGLAIGSDEHRDQFFHHACLGMLAEGRMTFLSLEGLGRPIAMLCCIRDGEGMFAYRTAYDEAFARFGPGVELFLAAMAHVARRTDAAWLDTSSTRDNQHLLGLFPDRRSLATFVFGAHNR